MQFGDAKTKKALLLCMGFFLLFSFFLDWIGNGADSQFHFYKARGKCAPSHPIWACKNYPTIFHILASLYAVRLELFKFFILFLFAFVTPMLLFLMCRKPVVVLLYFASSYFYAISAQMFAQGLALIFLLGIFATKNDLLRIAFLAIGIATHSHAFWLLAPAYFLLLLEENKKLGFLQCSPFWGKQGAPEPLNKPIISIDPPQALKMNTILSFFAKICPLPFLIIGLKELWKNREIAKFGIIAFSAIASVYNYRTLYVIPLLIMPAVACYHSRISKKKKRWLNLLILLFVAFQFEQFVAFNIIC
mgnify:CR=1 FL=1